jgi:hypothetical protein
MVPEKTETKGMGIPTRFLTLRNFENANCERDSISGKLNNIPQEEEAVAVEGRMRGRS